MNVEAPTATVAAKRAVFRTRDLARWCGVTRDTIANWVKDGRIPVFKTPGGHHRVSADAARAFLVEHGFPIPEELAL